MQSSDILAKVRLDDVTVVIPVKDESHVPLYHLKWWLETEGAEVIIVDDGSENPFEYSIQHEVNMGYGQALMTGILNASNDIIITIDGDGQHKPEEVKKLYTAYQLSGADMLIGARRLGYEKFLRMFGRKMLNTIASCFAFRWLSDLNSGARIFRKHHVTGYFPILCKTFSFTTSLTMSMLCDGFTVEWFPIKVEQRTHGKSHVKVVKDGLVTLYYIIRIGFALRTRKLRERWRKLKALFSL